MGFKMGLITSAGNVKKARKQLIKSLDSGQILLLSKIELKLKEVLK